MRSQEKGVALRKTLRSRFLSNEGEISRNTQGMTSRCHVENSKTLMCANKRFSFYIKKKLHDAI